MFRAPGWAQQGYLRGQRSGTGLVGLPERSEVAVRLSRSRFSCRCVSLLHRVPIKGTVSSLPLLEKRGCHTSSSFLVCCGMLTAGLVEQRGWRSAVIDSRQGLGSQVGGYSNYRMGIHWQTFISVTEKQLRCFNCHHTGPALP